MLGGKNDKELGNDRTTGQGQPKGDSGDNESTIGTCLWWQRMYIAMTWNTNIYYGVYIGNKCGELPCEVDKGEKT